MGLARALAVFVAFGGRIAPPLIVALLGVVAFGRAAEEPAPPAVLLELFTSQGCYSCPPAEALLRDHYADRTDVAPLEFHVDYWNDLVYGSAGKWADPFSKRSHTERQVAYNRNLRRTRSVYTPQIVVQGRSQAGGARQRDIDSFIQSEKGRESSLRFYFAGDPETGLTARLEGAMNGDEEFYHAVYWLREETVIPSGENKGKTLESRNIVTEFQGRRASRRVFELPPIDPAKEGCAVWAQRPGGGAVLAAARCPL